jgi:hypothetical protein
MYRYFNDYHNNNRLTCPQMPPDVKAEYIKKCKEYSLFRMDKFRKYQNEIKTADEANIQMIETAELLPDYLMMEVYDYEMSYDVDDQYNEESQFNDFIEFKPLFLYGQQVLRIYPDDYQQIIRTLINSSALLKTQLMVSESEAASETNA